MRISNLQFSRGSVIYARFSRELDYMNDRPLIIISDRIPVYDCVWAVPCGTQGKPGINISLFNYMTNDYVGGNPVTTVYPYNIYTINISKITSCIGNIDRHVLREIDKAVDYFLGRTDTIPEFLKEYEADLIGVTFQPASTLHTYIKENENPGAEYLRGYKADICPVQGNSGRNTWSIPVNPPASDQPKHPDTSVTTLETSGDSHKVPFRTPSPAPRPTTVSSITEDKIAEFLTLQCKLGPDQRTSVKALTDAYIKWSKIDVTVIGFSRVLNSYLTRINSAARKVKFNGVMSYQGIGLLNESDESEEPEPEEVDEEVTETADPIPAEDPQDTTEESDPEEEEDEEVVEEIVEEKPPFPESDIKLFIPRDSVNVRNWATVGRMRLEDISNASAVEQMDLESQTIIMSRQASIGAIRNKFGLTEEEAKTLQATVTEVGLILGNGIVSKIVKKGMNLSTLTEFEKVAVVVACKRYNLCTAPKIRVKLNVMISETMRKHHIDFQEKVVWADILV